MATWVTHLMIADRVLEQFGPLDRRGFCVGNIAPDCNIENEDWTQFVPPRAVTHWMSSNRKKASDCETFYTEYIDKKRMDIKSDEQYSFLLGYYAHLIADAEFQRFVRDEKRVAETWMRIKKQPALAEKSAGMIENWDSVKLLISHSDRMKDMYAIEAEYLKQRPDSGYFTEILGLSSFPDYIDYLPQGSIVRKIKTMGYIPSSETGEYAYIAMSKEEYDHYLDRSTALIIKALKDHCCST